MQHVTRREALTFVALGLGTAGAQAKSMRRIRGARELTPEVSTPGAISAVHRLRRGAVNISLMPLGPSSIAVGAPLAFRMVSTADGFAGLYALSASGRTQAWLENVRLRAGEPIVYPQQGLIVRAMPPAGDDTVLFLVSRDRFEGFAGAGEITTPFDLQYSHAGLRAAIQHKFSDVRRERWAFAELQIRVHD